MIVWSIYVCIICTQTSVCVRARVHMYRIGLYPKNAVIIIRGTTSLPYFYPTPGLKPGQVMFCLAHLGLTHLIEYQDLTRIISRMI